MLILVALREFIEDRTSLGRKKATLRFYKTHIGGLIKFLQEREICQVDGLTRAEVRAFFADLHRRGISQGTLAAYDRAMRVFCAFCVAEGWLADDPMKKRPRIKPPGGLPDTLSLEEIERLLTVCGDDAIGKRDRAIMLLMLDTGIRAGEVVALTPARLDMSGDRGRIFISAGESKGETDRFVPFWEGTLHALQSWLEVRPVRAITVFVASDGHRTLTTRPLTTSGLNQMMRRRAERAEVNGKHRWCHIWRHTFARQYVLAGGDLETLRRMLGHQSLETVRIYLGFKVEEIEERHFELSPVRRLFELSR